MIGLRSGVLLIVAGCGLMTATGCSRTSDGTIVMPTVPSPARYMPTLRPWKRAPAPEPVMVELPPPAPAPEAPPVIQPPRASKPAPFQTRQAPISMECNQAPQDGGRVRVVCS